MNFQQPFFLWTLLSLLPLVAIYFLRVRPRRRFTTAYFLWERVLQQKQRSALWQRLRNLWSLLLMAVAFAAVALATARPEWISDRSPDLLLIIDTSASMQTREGTVTRLELARQAAEEIIVAMDGHQRAAVASVGRDLTYLCHLTDSPRELSDALRQLRVSDDELTLDRLRHCVPDVTPTRPLRTIVFSDGNLGPGTWPAELELFRVGTAQTNVGLVRADMQCLSPGRCGFFWQCRVSGAERRQVNLRLLCENEAGSQVYRIEPLTLEPGLNRPQSITLEDAPYGRWTAELVTDNGSSLDSFLADDRAFLNVPPPDPIPVRIATSHRFFLENSVQAFSGNAGILTLVDATASANPDGKPWIDVALREVPDDARRTIVFAPQGDSDFWSGGESEVELLPRALLREHPVVRYIDTESMVFAGARSIRAPEGAQVWVEGDDGTPLIYQARRDDRSAVVVNLDPGQANFYFSAYFPVLVHSAAVHLSGRAASEPATVRPGDVIDVPANDTRNGTWYVTGPDGETQAIGTAASWRTTQRGFYRLAPAADAPAADAPAADAPAADAPTTRTVACTILSDVESNLDDAPHQTNVQPLRRGTVPATALTWLALLVVAAESWLYHRRKVG